MNSATHRQHSTDGARRAVHGTRPPACSVPDGLHDNRALQRRELWENGKCVEWVVARMLAPAKWLGRAWREPWGTYSAAQNAGGHAQGKPDPQKEV